MGLLALLVVAGGVGSFMRWRATVNQKVPLASMWELSSKAYLQFPPGARLLEGYWLKAPNTFGYARVELPPSQVTEFFKQPVFGGVIERRMEPAEEAEHINVADHPHDPALLDRWGLVKVRQSAYSSGGTLNGGPGSHFPVAALVDLDQPEHPVLYLHWYN